MQFTINKERLKAVKKLPLRKGTGASLNEQICVMQAVDYVTTGGFSDRPECVCPALTRYAIRLNDRANDKQRQLLKPMITKLVGTVGSKTKQRAELLVHHSITQVLPILVAAVDLNLEAKHLRSFKLGDWAGMQAYCTELNPQLREAMKTRRQGRGYAYAYAADADAAAAYAATTDADAADAYAAYADAAAAYAATTDADAAEKKYWRRVESRIWAKAFEGLKKACAIKG